MPDRRRLYREAIFWDTILLLSIYSNISMVLLLRKTRFLGTTNDQWILGVSFSGKLLSNRTNFANYQGGNPWKFPGF